MSGFPLTVDEIIETVKRTNLPTVVTEGRDDYTVFRFVEDEFDVLELSVMPVGGKSVLIDLFERRGELQKSPLFIMDQDLWVIFGVPLQYQSQDSLLFTAGFSIENDMYLDGALRNLLSRNEKKNFDQDLDEVCRWFACMLERIESGAAATLKTNPHQILGGSERVMSEAFKTQIGFVDPNPDLYQKIRSDYGLLLRGKTLLSLLAQHLSRPKRVAKHSFAGLLDYGSSVRGSRLQRVIHEIEVHFDVCSLHME